MAANRKLKVYRTPIGFHDAYVAASSQQAALEAWGADVDLFARGAAEVVTDPKLNKEPLSQPGAVIRKARGTAAEHINALPKSKAKAPTAKGDKAGSPAKSRQAGRAGTRWTKLSAPSRKPTHDIATRGA